MPRSNVERPTRWRAFASLAFIAVLPLACLIAVRALDPALSDPEANASLAWINAALVIPFVLVLWALTGRALLSGWIAWWVLWGLYALNAAKLEQLQRSLAPVDLILAGQVAKNLDLFCRYLVLDWLGMLAALAILAIAALLLRFEPRGLPPIRWRVPFLAVSLLLLSSILAGHAPWRAQLTDARLAGFQPWSPDHSTRRAGLVAGLIRLGWERWTVEATVTESQRDALDEFRARHADELQRLAGVLPPEVPPDLIVVQSEAMFDPGRLRGLESDDWMPAFRTLQAKGLHGDLHVPAYGGGTIRTEFEVLTGYPLAAFPEVVYPYYGLTDRPLQALPAQLARFGYRRFAVHPYERTFWNRDHALPNLGFEEMHFEGDPVFRDPDRRGPYVTDDQAYTATLSLLRTDRPQFAFVITMENHSPWRHRDNIDRSERDAIPVPDRLDAEARKALQTYLLHLQHGDAALRRLADAVLSRERPTLLLVYGDHLPAMPRVYEQLGFDDGRPPWEQRVPFVLVANFPMKTGRRDLTSDALAPLLLQAAGLPMDGYLAAATHIRRVAATCAVEANCLPLVHFAARAELGR